jgi:hypothetical protein
METASSDTQGQAAGRFAPAPGGLQSSAVAAIMPATAKVMVQAIQIATTGMTVSMRSPLVAAKRGVRVLVAPDLRLVHPPAALIGHCDKLATNQGSPKRLTPSDLGISSAFCSGYGVRLRFSNDRKLR